MKSRKPTRTPVAETELNLVEIPCAFCKGTGRDPFHVMSHLSNCPVCGGKRTVRIREPYETCKACEGTGRYFNSKMYCWICKGKGVVPCQAQATGITNSRPEKTEGEL